MTAVAIAETSGLAEQPWVLVDCHVVACAVPGRFVERLFAVSEARVVVAAPGLWMVAQVVGETLAACDLGTLLEMPALDEAWVVLRIPHRGRTARLALRTGRCLAVDRLGPVTALPAGIFRDRRGAFSGSFSPRGLTADASLAIVGLCLDPVALFSAGVLDDAASAVAGWHADGGRSAR